MFNAFGFLKKKQSKETMAQPTLEANSKPVIEKQIQLDNIAIHTMPERFRHQTVKVDDAKKTGLIIIGGGLVFLILVSSVMYYYLFKKPKVITETQTPDIVVNQPSEQIPEETPKDQNNTNSETGLATSTGLSTLPTEETLATTTATSTEESIEENLSVGLTPGLDSDNDSLTDAEEILLGTSTSTPDTDGDSYLDGPEVLNVYNPLGLGKLTADPNIVPYINNAFNYSLLYLKSWQSSVNGGDDSVMFKSNDNEFIQVIVQPNVNKQLLDQWYEDQLSVTSINDSDRISGSGWQGIMNPDGLTIYLTNAKRDYIFTLTYNPGENNILEYQNIFMMMVKSFMLKE
jgi:hypothetical protein